MHRVARISFFGFALAGTLWACGSESTSVTPALQSPVGPQRAAREIVPSPTRETVPPAVPNEPTSAVPSEVTSDPRTYGATDCRIETPRLWNAGTITWLGPCEAGFAHGVGVLRNMVLHSQTQLFLGRAEQGYLRSGVIETEEGFIAGRWREGALVNDDLPEGDEVIEEGVDLAAHRTVTAFEDAARAADDTSRRMAEQSNAASSRFYANLAERLRSQMD